MAISSVTAATERPEERDFYVAIDNVGDRDVVVNLGYMIANGKVMFPEAVRLLLTDSYGARAAVLRPAISWYRGSS